MKTTTAIVLAFALSLLQCVSIASSKAVPGYVFTATKSSQGSLLKPSTSDAVYNDQDVKDFVLHNIGMLNQNSEVSESAQDLISQYGNRNYFKQDKLNYVFLVDGASSQNLLQNEKFQADHQTVLVDVCSNEDSSECLLQRLFNTKDKTSVVNSLTKISKKDQTEAYVYSSNDAVAADFGKSALSSAVDQKGNIYLLESRANAKLKVASSLESCVNSALKGKYTVNIEKRTVTNKANTESFAVPEAAKTDFLQFMTDVCSVVSTSTLIRKQSSPSFFAFHINSLGKLQQSLSNDQQAELYKVFDVAYEQFVANILTHYTRSEVSGQVLFLSSDNTIQASERLVKRHPWDRILADTDAGQVTDDNVNYTTQTIFVSVLIVFALITAWVCIEMFSIDVQKDSVVYAKFLAGDYFRR